MDHQLYLEIDVGKAEHHATALTAEGTVVHDKTLPQSEPKIRALLESLETDHGPVLVVVDQPKTIGALVIAIAQDLGIEVAYLPGLTMRRIADLHPGQAKTDARDAFIIADTHPYPAPHPGRDHRGRREHRRTGNAVRLR